MALMIGGLLLWAAVHLSVRLAPAPRRWLIDKLGIWPYQGLFSLLLIGAIVLMVRGWKTSPPTEILYTLPGTQPIAMVLMALAACLFVAGRAPTDVRRYLRHPQLTSVVVWAIAHLLANGDARSLLLFGGLGLWAIVEMRVINRAEGPWQKPPVFGAGKTALSTAIGLAVFAVLLFAHPWLSGVAII